MCLVVRLAGGADTRNGWHFAGAENVALGLGNDELRMRAESVGMGGAGGETPDELRKTVPCGIANGETDSDEHGNSPDGVGRDYPTTERITESERNYKPIPKNYMNPTRLPILQDSPKNYTKIYD